MSAISCRIEVVWDSCTTSESSDDSESDLSGPTNPPDLPCVVCPVPNDLELKTTVTESQFNWFQLAETVLGGCLCEEEEREVVAINQLDDFFRRVMASEHFTAEQLNLIQQSHDAFLYDREERLPLAKRQAAAANGEVVTDSETDDCEDYLELSNTMTEKARALIARRRKSIQRKVRHLRAKMIAEQNFLSRKQSHRVRGILKDCPDIGQVIEAYVQDRNVGADAWRRTGVLTFDGNAKVKQKVTFNRIREHLHVQSVYKRKFSHGSVVQLCVARNKRRTAAQRYKGVARVTCRRARKGFQLKFNPDSHWSNSLYRGLALLQYTDGRHITNVNRDDASGFRLDTMATHRLHRTPMVQGHQALTTYTDYVNRYPSLLHTTSYNFSATQTTAEVCAGIVKPSGIFPKNPAQHAADFSFLEKQLEFQPVTRKIIECIRVDGASDEGPSHEEVQFFWTLHHITTPTVVTLVSARNSGASYLNRVELQNGCLALAHANLFVPSTLGGSCLDTNTGKVDPEKFKHNMQLATDVYISRVNGCPCGEGTIRLFKGADSTELQELREKLLQYLKGSNRQQEVLRRKDPQIYSYLEEVWAVRNNHMVKDLPTQYLFHLVCCYKPTCSHPFCQAGTHKELPKWFPGGPDVSYLPLPICDPARPWGSPNCPDCSGSCYGHFLKPEVAILSPLPGMKKPPSTVIKEVFQKIEGSPSEKQVQETAKAVLLSPEEVMWWFNHLQTVTENRRRGARKAAETRRKKKMAKQSVHDVYYCGVCHDQYMQYTDRQENWIGCEACDSWFHFACIGITVETIPDKFFCEDCKDN